MRRYSEFGQVIETTAGKLVSGLPFVDLLYTGKLVYHSVSVHEQGRLDLIAYKYLKDFSLWPLIAWYNGIIDPLSDIKVGCVLAIPIDIVSSLRELLPFTYRGSV